MANVLLLGGKDLLLTKQSPGILYGISLCERHLDGRDRMVLGTGRPVRGQSDRVRIHILGCQASIYPFNRLAYKIESG